MRTESFKLTASDEFTDEVTRICQQYPGFQRVRVSGRLHEIEDTSFTTGEKYIYSHPSLIINAWFDGVCITVNAAQSDVLMAKFYDKLARTFEVDLHPAPLENY